MDSSLPAASLKPTCVRAAFVLEDALDTCSRHMEAKELTADIHIDRSMNIRADAHYITQVFRNLLENSCRYAPKGSVITITGEPSPFESMAVFTVSDQGPRIPPELRERIFEPFFGWIQPAPGILAEPAWGWPWSGPSQRSTAAA